MVILLAGPSAGQTVVISTWNPICTAGDWFASAVSLCWLHDPPFPIGPMPVSPPPDGAFVFIPSGTVNLSLAASVTELTVTGDAELTINAGSVTSTIAVVNSSDIQMDSAASLTTALFENTPLATLDLTSGSFMLVGDLNNGGDIDMSTSVITAAAIQNESVIKVAMGLSTIIAPSIDNNGQINVGDNAGGLIFASAGTALTGSGLLQLDESSATLTTAGSLHQGSGHTIRGRGVIDAGAITNDGLIAADVMGEQLQVVAGILSNQDRLVATTLSRMSVTALNLTNGGLIEANSASSMSLEGDDFDNNATVRAAGGSVIDVEDFDIANSGSLFEAVSSSQMNFRNVRIRGGTLNADASSFMTTAGASNRWDSVPILMAPTVMQVLPGAVIDLRDGIVNDGSIELHGNAAIVIPVATVIGGGGGDHDGRCRDLDLIEQPQRTRASSRTHDSGPGVGFSHVHGVGRAQLLESRGVRCQCARWDAVLRLAHVTAGHAKQRRHLPRIGRRHPEPDRGHRTGQRGRDRGPRRLNCRTG